MNVTSSMLSLNSALTNCPIDFSLNDFNLEAIFKANLEKLLIKVKLITNDDLDLAKQISYSTKQDVFSILNNLLIVNTQMIKIGNNIIKFMFYNNIAYESAIAIFQYCYYGKQDVIIVLENYAKIHEITSYLTNAE